MLLEAAWPPDTVDEIFFHRALVRLLTKLGINDDGSASEASAATEEFVLALQRGDLRAVGQFEDGDTIPVPPKRWKSPFRTSAIFATGLSQEHRSIVGPYGMRAPALIFLTQASVEAYFTSLDAVDASLDSEGPGVRLVRRGGRVSEQRRRALEAIHHHYPGGVPDIMQPAELARVVKVYCVKQGFPKPYPDKRTVGRARAEAAKTT